MTKAFKRLRTERLVLRSLRPDDVSALARRRSHPDVARYQSWGLPYSEEQAHKLVSSIIDLDGPKDDRWWMAVVSEQETEQAIGDLAVHLTSEGRTAEVGFLLAREEWGNGYATEALAAMVEWLFDAGVTRQFGMLHPDNRASAMVLERCGFLFEGHTKSSYWVGDRVSDDWIYGLTRPDWDKWRNRPRDAPDHLRLLEISQENERAVYQLRTHKSQEAFVAPMKRSYADALFPEVYEGAPLAPWMRVIDAGDEYVGFVMLALRTDHHPEPYLWRLLIDRLHQRRGIGGRVLDLIAAEIRDMGDETLLTSWVEGRGSPAPFYLRHGFEPTGRIIDGEVEARLSIM